MDDSDSVDERHRVIEFVFVKDIDDVTLMLTVFDEVNDDDCVRNALFVIVRDALAEHDRENVADNENGKDDVAVVPD